jgi:hypothetical protein
MIDLTILTAEPAEAYHAKSRDYLSSHQLIEFAKCPYLYKKRISGLLEEKDTPAYFLGRAAHTRILEGLDAYQLQYAIGGPINPATGKPFGSTTKKFLEWQETQQKPVIPFEKADLIEAMNAGVRMNPLACKLLESGKAEGVVRAVYRDLPCQIRIDWTHPEYGIVDLKTCDDLDSFESDTRKYGYKYQLAFYYAVLKVAAPNLSAPAHIIAVEKREPYRCGVWIMPEETLSQAQASNEAAIERLKIARICDSWPTGYETARILSM